MKTSEKAASAPIVPTNSLPLGMQPAPATKPRMSEPIDIGQWHPAYTGWYVVFDLGANMTMFDALEEMQDAEGDFKRIKATQLWLTKCLYAWNFTVTDAVTEVTTLLPQPRDGGMTFCPYELLIPIARAFNTTIKIPKS